MREMEGNPMGDYKIAALVPMRHHSQRVPGKNYRVMAGKPLYAHIITTLLSVPEIGQIVVDTDSPVILNGLKKDFPTVISIDRPEGLRADTIPMNEILMYDTQQVPADFYLQTHSTNPVLTAATISRGINAFLCRYPAYDSMFSVTRRQVRFWDQLGRPINHNPAILIQTQDLPPVYEENSCMYLFTRSSLEHKRNRLGDRPMMFEVSAEEAWDVDEELDFKMAELMLTVRSGK
jgi:CMP-N-acetylneuraminic acid synthetase